MKEYKILSADGIFYLLYGTNIGDVCDKAHEDGIVIIDIWELGEESSISFANEEAA